MSRRNLTLSSEPTQGQNEGCLIKPRSRNPEIARLMRSDCDEVRLNAVGDHPAVENLAGRMGKDAQKYGFGALPSGDSMAANLEHGWIGRLSVRPESGLIS
jgi:hypothetical protein